ncbi:MAG TPA: PepSY-like domain-containing protein [Chitinophagaceae bacterium]
MKKIAFMFMAVAVFCSCAFAITPPKAVKDAFDKKFSTATKISWGKEAAKEWEAEFTFEGSKISANFYEDGTWLETEREIKAVSLPIAVAAAIKKNYQGWTITEADKTETAKHGTIYEADLKKGKAKKAAAYKEDGTPVSE